MRAGEKDPRAEGDHVQDADEIVRRRVVGPLLVAVVEPVQLGEHDPGRQRREEEDELGLERDALRGSLARRHLRGEERNREPEQVGGEQHAAHQPRPLMTAVRRRRSTISSVRSSTAAVSSS